MHNVVNMDKDIFLGCTGLLLPEATYVHDIDDRMARIIDKRILDANNKGYPLLPLYIQSDGGEAHALISIIASIENSAVPVLTYCMGKAMSAGAILLACGTPGYRFCNQNSSVMVHSILTGYGNDKIHNISNDVDFTKRLNSQLFTILNKKCKKKQGFFEKKMSANIGADIFLNAEMVKEYGMVDYIGVPFLETNIEISHELKHK